MASPIPVSQMSRGRAGTLSNGVIPLYPRDTHPPFPFPSSPPFLPLPLPPVPRRILYRSQICNETKVVIKNMILDPLCKRQSGRNKIRNCIIENSRQNKSLRHVHSFHPLSVSFTPIFRRKKKLVNERDIDLGCLAVVRWQEKNSSFPTRCNFMMFRKLFKYQSGDSGRV